MKIGFAITAYDKFEEAKILIEIIRKEFKGDYKISFCSNHSSGKVFAQENDVDAYIQGRDIPYFQADIHNPDSLQNRISIVLRSTDTVQRSCLNAMTMDVDYIIHMHSDAWVLNEDKLNDLIKLMVSNNKRVAFRGGTGFDYAYMSQMMAMDDHFFIFEKEFAIESKLFEFSPEYFFPERYNVHEILFMNFLVKAGLQNIWCYRKIDQLYNYDGKIHGWNTLRPVSWDPQYMFLHIHRGSFPGTYGAQIQANYLKKCGFSKSDFIQQFIHMHIADDDKILDELGIIENKLDSKLKFWGFDGIILNNREIIYKQHLLNNARMQDFIMNRIKKVVKKMQVKNRKRCTYVDVLSCYKQHFGDVIDYQVIDEFWD